MEPKIINIGSINGEMQFEMIDTELCVVNSLRRIALTNINCLVFRGFPHTSNLINIQKNTSKFNNEYLKHRIQCIPICYSDETNFDAFINQYEVKLNVSNDTNNIRYVTTEDLILYDKKTGNPINTSGSIKTKQIFPPDSITGHYIVIAVLMPKITEDDIIEELQITMEFSLGNAKQDSCWNVVTKCCYENKKDEVKLTKFFKKNPEIVTAYFKNDVNAIETYMKTEMSEYDKKDFDLLNGQRFYNENNYIVKIESVGIYTTEEIIYKSCQYIIKKLSEFIEYTKNANIENSKINTGNEYGLFIDKSNTNLMYYLYIPTDDYTIGKIIEKYLYMMFSKDIYYVSFKKEHPHDNHSYVLFCYNNDTEVSSEIIINNLRSVSSELIKIYEIISSKFK